MTKQLQTEILETWRVPKSKNGNLNVVVHTKSGTYRTGVDSQVAYGIENSEYLGEVILTIDDGRIVGVQTLDGKYHTGSIG